MKEDKKPWYGEPPKPGKGIFQQIKDVNIIKPRIPTSEIKLEDIDTIIEGLGTYTPMGYICEDGAWIEIEKSKTFNKLLKEINEKK